MSDLTEAIINLGDAQTEVTNSKKSLRILCSEMEAEENQLRVQERRLRHFNNEVIFRSLEQESKRTGIPLDPEIVSTWAREVKYFSGDMDALKENTKAEVVRPSRREGDAILSHADIASRVVSSGIGKGFRK